MHFVTSAVYFLSNLCKHDSKTPAKPAYYDRQGLTVPITSGETIATGEGSTVQTKNKISHSCSFQGFQPFTND